MHGADDIGAIYDHGRWKAQRQLLSYVSTVPEPTGRVEATTHSRRQVTPGSAGPGRPAAESRSSCAAQEIGAAPAAGAPRRARPARRPMARQHRPDHPLEDPAVERSAPDAACWSAPLRWIGHFGSCRCGAVVVWPSVLSSTTTAVGPSPGRSTPTARTPASAGHRGRGHPRSGSPSAQVASSCRCSASSPNGTALGASSSHS